MGPFDEDAKLTATYRTLGTMELVHLRAALRIDLELGTDRQFATRRILIIDGILSDREGWNERRGDGEETG